MDDNECESYIDLTGCGECSVRCQLELGHKGLHTHSGSNDDWDNCNTYTLVWVDRPPPPKPEPTVFMKLLERQAKLVPGTKISFPNFGSIYTVEENKGE